MIRQISVCGGGRGWFEFGLSAKQESEHGEQSQSQHGWGREGSVRFVPSTFMWHCPVTHCAITVHPKTSGVYSGAVKSRIWGLKLSKFTQSQVLCSMDGCGIEFYGGGAKPFVGWAAIPR